MPTSAVAHSAYRHLLASAQSGGLSAPPTETELQMAQEKAAIVEAARDARFARSGGGAPMSHREYF